jgi:GAF domain-containing protein
VEFLREPQLASPVAPLGRVERGEVFAHVPDIAVEEYHERAGLLVRQGLSLGGFRTVLAVPMRKDTSLLGAITIYRQEVLPFSDKQIALLQNFAAQAVIAIENARLLNELHDRTRDLQESLEYQTATSDVLKVISRSTFDLQPIFFTIIATAARLCDADDGIITIHEGDIYKLVASFGAAPEFDAVMKGRLFPVNRGSLTGRTVLEREVVHIHDIAADPEYTQTETLALQKNRTMLGVPLLGKEGVVGTINLGRLRVDPFTERQIELVRTFADQAVIAVENTRLLTELRESLEQQTATAEVLQVINSSPGDLAPVFDAMLEKAHSLCGVARGSLELYDGENFRAVATRGLEGSFADQLRQGYLASNNPATRPLIEGLPFTQIVGVPRQEFPFTRSPGDAVRTRTLLCVPLRRDDKLLGMIASSRDELRPFTEKQIALLQNFAAQAVIAMENARLLGELQQRTGDLQESLEYQTATSDVLKVISQSTFDLEPVLQTVLDTAMRLCGNIQGSIFRLGEDGLYRQAVGSGMQPEYYEIEAQQEIRPGSATLVGRTAAGARPIQITDAWTDPDYAPKEDARVGQLRSMLGVPLLREGTPIGVICTARTTVKPFTEKEIELVATFADQAVIAIENARLLGELRQREAELRVTFDNMADGVAMFDQM